jgi:hypothetical protein
MVEIITVGVNDPQVGGRGNESDILEPPATNSPVGADQPAREVIVARRGDEQVGMLV